MTSPANLTRALNHDKLKLSDIFDVDETNVKIHRRMLWVATTDDEKRIYDDKIEQKNIENRAYRLCVICGTRCLRSQSKKMMFGTCNDVCRQKKIAENSLKISQSHWCKSARADEICNKRIQTRKQNDVLLNREYVAWNKGKRGMYSAETIRKISDAALAQFSKKVFRKTNVEKAYEEILKSLNVEYVYSYVFNRRQFDFFIPSIKTFVEIHGDFWHGNPKFWGSQNKPLREHQKMKRLDDFVKKNLVERFGYRYIEFWENDIYKNSNNVVKKTKELFND
jgi:G:T-mismatch repair DNA endonuclease (very short patch repair protein)